MFKTALKRALIISQTHCLNMSQTCLKHVSDMLHVQLVQKREAAQMCKQPRLRVYKYVPLVRWERPCVPYVVCVSAMRNLTLHYISENLQNMF